jgi:single-strand DNA-binding protein
MNIITLIGNLTADPEVRSTPSGVTVCSFTIAVNRRFANSEGERQTDFFRINAWRQLGEVCAKHLAKGRKVAVVGELQARMYDAKNGEKRMSLDVAADEVEFLSPAEKAETKPQKKSKENSDGYDQTPADEWATINTNDLPF